jgi:hypothetical protein
MDDDNYLSLSSQWVNDACLHCSACKYLRVRGGVRVYRNWSFEVVSIIVWLLTSWPIIAWAIENCEAGLRHGCIQKLKFQFVSIIVESLSPRFMAHRSHMSKTELQVGVKLRVHPETEISIGVTYCWRDWACLISISNSCSSFPMRIRRAPSPNL